jgi:hypothetical protein
MNKTQDSQEYQIEDTQKIIKDTSDFMTKLSDVMSEPTFREFFDTHFSDWNDSKAVFMMMKAYQMLDDESYKVYNKRLQPPVLADMLKRIMFQSDTRRYLTQSMTEFMNGSNSDKEFTQICHKMLLKHK